MEQVLTVRADAALLDELEDFAKSTPETKSEVVREAIEQFLQKEIGLAEVKHTAAKAYAEGKLAFDDLVKIVGYENAKKIAFYVDLAEKSFEEGLK